MKLPFAIAVAATLLAACQESLCGCSPSYPDIHFMGSVMRGGSPITDARVAAQVTRDGCRFGPPMSPNPFEDSVNAGGYYDLRVEWLDAGPYCARLVARWPGDSAVRDSIRVVAPSHVVVDFDVP